MSTNRTVTYRNKMNTIDCSGWTKKEMDLFSIILSFLKDKGTDLIVIEKSQLRKIDPALCHPSDSMDKIKSYLKKLSSFSFIEKHPLEDGFSLECVHIFDRCLYTYIASKDEAQLEIQLNANFFYLLNMFDKEHPGFTTFELAEYLSLKSEYSKQIYKLCKQYRTQGFTEAYPLPIFLKLMGIENDRPTKYLTRSVIKPAVKELCSCFAGLEAEYLHEVIKDRDGNEKKGQKVVGVRFRFKPEKSAGWVDGQPKRKKKPEKKAEEPKSKAKMPSWYYREDPGVMDAAMLEEIRALQKEIFHPEETVKQEDVYLDEEDEEEDLPY